LPFRARRRSRNAIAALIRNRHNQLNRLDKEINGDARNFMEIQLLKLLVTEQDINTLVTRALAHEPQVRDVKVSLGPEGVHVSGVYPTAFMSVRFQTLWEVSVEAGKVAARLADLKVVGLPVTMLRPTIMAALADAVAKEDAIQVKGEHLLFDPNRLFTKNGLTGSTNLTSIRSEPGQLVIEAGLA
jgi:hypothetical protein